MDPNSLIGGDRWMCDYCQGRRRVGLPFHWDQWGHGNAKDHFLWSKALEVKGQYQQLPKSVRYGFEEEEEEEVRPDFKKGINPAEIHQEDM